MSLIFAPEAVSVVAPPLVARTAPPRPDTRPIEPSDDTNAGSSEQKQNATSRDTSRDPSAKPQPSPRPPGTDPSLPPQTLLDASLISEDFKPTTRPEPAETANPAEASSAANDEPQSASERSDSNAGAPASSGTGSEGGSRVDARQIAAYGRASGGSVLTQPAYADPDWLTAVEKIA